MVPSRGQTTNSALFQRILDQCCETEELWKRNGGWLVKKTSGPSGSEDTTETLYGLNYKIQGVDSIHWEKSPVRVLPYNQLREKLGQNKVDEGQRAVRELDRLSLCKFLIEQIIDGCAQSLRFESEKNKLHELIKTVKKIRDSDVLNKNPAWRAERAYKRAVAACTISPSVSSVGRLSSFSPLFSEYGEIRDNQIPIEFHKYGCAYFQRDLIKNPKKYDIATSHLLALNLEYIFRNWHPESIEGTYPTYPPKKQPRRGQEVDKPTKPLPPRFDIVALFVNALFPLDEIADNELSTSDTSANDSRKIKEKLKDFKATGAVFCGW